MSPCLRREGVCAMESRKSTFAKNDLEASDNELSFDELEELAKDATNSVKQTHRSEKANEVFWTTSFQSHNILLPMPEAFEDDKLSQGASHHRPKTSHQEFDNKNKKSSSLNEEGFKERARIARGTSDDHIFQKNEKTEEKKNKWALPALGSLGLVAVTGFVVFSFFGKAKENESVDPQISKGMALDALPETSIKSVAQHSAQEKPSKPIEPVKASAPSVLPEEQNPVVNNQKEEPAKKADKRRIVKEQKESAQRRIDQKEEKQPLKKIEKKSPSKEPIKSAPKSIDELLSSATTSAAPKVVSDQSRKNITTTKTRIDRSDVTKAMSAVAGKAGKCQKLEGASGTVSIKFTVDPTGSVLKAKAKSDHASSKTGLCVVKAVKSAKFPPFNGRPTSFTYPFLMTR